MSEGTGEMCLVSHSNHSDQGLLHLDIYEKKLYALLRQLKNAISLLIQILEMKMDFIEEKFLIIES